MEKTVKSFTFAEFYKALPEIKRMAFANETIHLKQYDNGEKVVSLGGYNYGNDATVSEYHIKVSDLDKLSKWELQIEFIKMLHDLHSKLPFLMPIE